VDKRKVRQFPGESDKLLTLTLETGTKNFSPYSSDITSIQCDGILAHLAQEPLLYATRGALYRLFTEPQVKSFGNVVVTKPVVSNLGRRRLLCPEITHRERSCRFLDTASSRWRIAWAFALRRCKADKTYNV
jgi:hypothetical protein